MAAAPEQIYRYPRSSTVVVEPAGTEVALATSGGVTSRGPAAHPVFFDGFLGHPEQSAAALLAVAKVARTRFYTPPGMVAAILRAADPVVTSNGDRLRFESFSACCGVYARYDVLPGALDGPAIDTGTTNVDFNPPMRRALATVGGLDPVHLRVGEDVEVTTMEATVVERKVPLPERWLKGFVEVQLVAAVSTPAFEVPAAEARRFLRSLPATAGRKPLWVVPAGRGLRLTSRPNPSGVSLSGTDRLKPLEPLLRFARALRAYAAPYDPLGAGGIWELDLDDARLVVGLSPDLSRGFSGEGGVLWDLADDATEEDADVVSALLAFEPRIDVARLAVEAGLAEDRVRRALGRLGAAGRVGFDAADSAYFHRELPYDAERLAAMHPRLRDARALVEAGAVRLDGSTGYVTSGGTEHVVRRTPEGDRCTCPWFGRHRASRGPCKHALAVDLERRGT
ncbi:SWIM zinc finger family protein [Nocardioides guangzhouensis]|uniref:SWIM zinc finger family protein n=1 Tax=Nocardioides guangzhouensis TaxID=2497878 RepID=UPI001C37964B|nr:SWIM zinc finger family protein [Nocardioides guangzhouensis]